MNRKCLLFAAFLLAAQLLTHANDSIAFIQFESFVVAHAIYPEEVSPHVRLLVQDLERITGLSLEVQNQYLTIKEPKRLPLLFAGSGMREVFEPRYSDHPWSPTARQLLLSAIRSNSVYRVREDGSATLGKVDSVQTIELNFGDFDRIIYRDLPRESFDAGMIFFHELVHRHLRLKDPTPDEIRKHPRVKGDTVEFVNRIERELGLPERRQYAPIKIRVLHNRQMWGIYFGDKTDRIEFDTSFILR